MRELCFARHPPPQPPLTLVFGDTLGLSVPCHLPVACLGALVIAISAKGGQVIQGWLLKDLGVETGPNPTLAVSGDCSPGTRGSFLSVLRSASSLQDGTQATGMDLKTRISDSTLRLASRSLKGGQPLCLWGTLKAGNFLWKPSVGFRASPGFHCFLPTIVAEMELSVLPLFSAAPTLLP